MGQALYRKYRSRTLDDVVGQSHITTMLKNAIAGGHIAHAYLLTGPRGVGKTSIARILAHEINNLPYDDESTHLDIIEIDAASNNSVEDIRDLREKVMVAPVSASKKVYIIDEVHMLSKSAFNALLKTLEEPPEHVVFILATTDAEKLPATIISRVQRFNFRLINEEDVVAHLGTIAKAEHIPIDDDALALVARHGGGSFRDSISLLDQLQGLSGDTITPALVESVVGMASKQLVDDLLAARSSHDIATLARLITDAETRGVSALTIADQLIQTIRETIGTHPEYLTLLDTLLDVAKTPWPHVKLLTVLAAPTPGHAAAAPAVMPAPVAAPTPKAAVTPPEPKVAPKESPKKEAVASEQPEPPKMAEPEAPTTDQPFPWADFIAYVKDRASGAYSLLAKSNYTFNGTMLTIYAGKAFNKKQIDKAITHLSEALDSVGVSEGTITVLASAKPPKDSQVADVLDIMGGGEEVVL